MRHTPLICVRGKCLVGKKRFVQEVCQYLHLHNQFLDTIFFYDLANIENSKKKLNGLLSKLENILSGEETPYNFDQDDTEQLISSQKTQDRRILLAFTNVDHLKESLWDNLEAYLFDICGKKNRAKD